MRLTTLLATVAALVLIQAGLPAQAGLIGASNTVAAIFWNGAVDSPSGANHHGTELPTQAHINSSTSGSVSLASSVSYPDSNLDFANITINDTTITIENALSGPTEATAHRSASLRRQLLWVRVPVHRQR